MSESIDEIVSRLKFLRMSLLPPYCENLDEDEKSVFDYVAHFTSHLEQCREDARLYLGAIAQLSESSNDNTLRDLFAARTRFAESFPFCVDELVTLSEDEAKPYRDYMAKIYREDVAEGFLAKTVAQYIALLDEITL